MWSIFLTATADKDSLIAELWERGTCGLIEEPEGVRAFFEDAAETGAIAHRFGETASPIREEQPFDGQQFHRGGWEPVLAGERFYIVPPWLAGPAPEGRLRLEVDASTAFGTGRHESTQLCLQALEKYLKHGDTVLDIGCGSGILMAAAGLLGAGSLFGCDIDCNALSVARRHVHAPLFAGSADAVRGTVSDITIANISARVVDHLAGELKRVTKLDGIMVLAGFIERNPPRRFRRRELSEQGEWQCWICRPEDVDAAANEAAETGSHSREWWI